MKNLLTASLLLILIACGKTNDHPGHDQHEAIGDKPNQALSDEVDQIHMDVMGKMDEVYALKGTLSEKITTNPTMAEDAKIEVSKTIMQLDSAYKVMMDFMHQPQPPDSIDAEIAREFYETEIETIKKIRDFFDETITRANAIVVKK